MKKHEIDEYSEPMFQSNRDIDELSRGSRVHSNRAGKLVNTILSALVVFLAVGVGILFWNISAAKTEYDTELQQQEADHIAEINDINDAHAQEMEDANHQHQLALANLKVDYEHQLDELTQLLHDATHIEVSPDVHVTIESLKSIITQSSELTSTKYYYSTAAVYEKETPLFNTSASAPLGTSKYIFKANGVIGAGIELRDLQFNVDNDAKVITVSYPKPKMLSHTVVNEPVDAVVTAAYNKISEEEREDFHKRMLVAEEEKLLNNPDFWNNVRESAEKAVTNILLVSNQTENYSIVHKWPSAAPDRNTDGVLLSQTDDGV